MAAEIVVLPIRFGGPDQVTRITADLAGAHARGVDLGSRALHIRAGGERLREMGHALENALNDLAQSLPESARQDWAANPDIRRLLKTIRGLADTAQRVPPSAGHCGSVA